MHLPPWPPPRPQAAEPSRTSSILDGIRSVIDLVGANRAADLGGAAGPVGAARGPGLRRRPRRVASSHPRRVASSGPGSGKTERIGPLAFPALCGNRGGRETWRGWQVGRGASDRPPVQRATSTARCRPPRREAAPRPPRRRAACRRPAFLRIRRGAPRRPPAARRRGRVGAGRPGRRPRPVWASRPQERCVRGHRPFHRLSGER